MEYFFFCDFPCNRVFIPYYISNTAGILNPSNTTVAVTFWFFWYHCTYVNYLRNTSFLASGQLGCSAHQPTRYRLSLKLRASWYCSSRQPHSSLSQVTHFVWCVQLATKTVMTGWSAKQYFVFCCETHYFWNLSYWISAKHSFPCCLFALFFLS